MEEIWFSIDLHCDTKLLGEKGECWRHHRDDRIFEVSSEFRLQIVD